MADLASAQTWSAEGYEKNARFVSDLGAEILSWLAPAPGMRVLDLGCGDGALTSRIADTGAYVVGIEPSESLRAAASARSLDMRRASVTQMTFDAIFSIAVLHWVNEPSRAIERMRAALKPAGRFVAEFGGHGKIAAIVTAMRAGLYPRQTLLPTVMSGWLETFRAPFFVQFAERAEDVKQEVEDLLRPALCDASGHWMADYVRLRIEAVAV